MAIQRHPIDSFDKTLNFWEEFQDYKVHAVFGDFYRLNKEKKKLKESSLFMWALTLCYDRKSALYNQPEIDKWEVVSEDLFGDSKVVWDVAEDPTVTKYVHLPLGMTFALMKSEYQESIDSPLGITLKRLEAKLTERTRFIEDTKYTLDSFETTSSGRQVRVAGTAFQIDRMFADTAKIVGLVQAAMDALKQSEGEGGTIKGGGRASMSDEDKDF